MWPDRADAGTGANTAKHESRWLLFIKSSKVIAAQTKASKKLISCLPREASSSEPKLAMILKR